MADAICCPNCGAGLPAGAPAGLCLRCRMHGDTYERPSLPGASAGDDLLATGDYSSGSAPAPGALGETSDWSDVPSGPTRAGATPVAPAVLRPGVSVRYFGDYEIRRELGRGGMGVVYEARQVSLNRPVALKMIKAGLLADDAELRRFQNEAEAVALLDHPGIVSAYEVGEHDGQQYLSMKLVRGEGLNSLLQRYRDDPRAAAALVAEAAEAVAHAHSRGILHRDLKPANILVDAEGRPHVTDFGLAKRLDVDQEMTASGAILGTPAYMAPEQASGHRAGITVATDVYGLGSVLYTLLAGRAPFGGDTVVETLDALRTRPPEPPTRLNGGVPRDLETICLKCLEKDPRRRYASAQALADDLRAWLESRPIAARRVGVAERAWLWCRRRPAVAALAGLAALAAVGGTAATIAVQANANIALRAKNQELTLAFGREARANADLAAANARVEQRYGLAMDAIKTFHTGVSEDFLLKEPKFKDLRDRLLKSAGDFYERLGRDLKGAEDVASRRAILASNFELAGLDQKLGRREEALALHRRVLAGREAIAAEPGADASAKVEAGRSLNATISLLKQVGLTAEVPPLLARAVAFHERVAADHPDDPDARDALAQILVQLGDQLKNVDSKRDEAERVFRRALEITEVLARAHPDEPKYLAAQANPLSYLSYLRADEGKYEETIRLHRKILDLAREQLARDPRDLRLRSELAGRQSLMSTWYNAARRFDESLGPARAAVESWREIVAAQPAVLGHRQSLAGAHYALGQALTQAGRLAEGDVELREALAIHARLAAENPGLRELRLTITNDHASLGYVLLERGRPDEAEAEYRKALAIQRELVAEEPTNHDLKDSLAISHLNLGRLLLNADRASGAEVEFREAIAILAAIAREQPAMVLYRLRGATTHRFLATALQRSGRLPEAEAAMRESLRITRAAADSMTGVSWADNELATAHNNLGDVIRAGGRMSEAQDEYERAIAIRERLVREDPKTPVYRSHLAWSLRRRGLTRIELGDFSGGVDDIHRALSLWDGLETRSPEEWFETACGHATLAGLSGRGDSGVPPVASPAESDTALRSMSRAVGQGYRDRRAIRDERALDAVRDRPEFRTLMMDLAMPSEPFAP